MTGGGFPYLACYASAIHFSFDHQEDGERWLATAQRMAEAEHLPPTGLALVEIARRRTDEAIAWLETAHAQQDSAFAWIRALCEQLDLIADERIRRTMSRLGLP